MGIYIYHKKMQDAYTLLMCITMCGYGIGDLLIEFGYNNYNFYCSAISTYLVSHVIAIIALSIPPFISKDPFVSLRGTWAVPYVVIYTISTGSVIGLFDVSWWSSLLIACYLVPLLCVAWRASARVAYHTDYEEYPRQIAVAIGYHILIFGNMIMAYDEYIRHFAKPIYRRITIDLIYWTAILLISLGSPRVGWMLQAKKKCKYRMKI